MKVTHTLSGPISVGQFLRFIRQVIESNMVGETVDSAVVEGMFVVAVPETTPEFFRVILGIEADEQADNAFEFYLGELTLDAREASKATPLRLADIILLLQQMIHTNQHLDSDAALNARGFVSKNFYRVTKIELSNPYIMVHIAE